MRSIVLLAVYRQCDVIYTDHWDAYQVVLLVKRHQDVSKDNRKTSYIEWLNNTLWQRGSRFGPQSLAFSKSLQHNHISLLPNFINHYNASFPLYDYRTLIRSYCLSQRA